MAAIMWRKFNFAVHNKRGVMCIYMVYKCEILETNDYLCLHKKIKKYGKDTMGRR